MMPDTELASVVRDDHRVAHKAVMADGTPYTGFRDRADRIPVENIDALVQGVDHWQ